MTRKQMHQQNIIGKQLKKGKKEATKPTDEQTIPEQDQPTPTGESIAL